MYETQLESSKLVIIYRYLISDTRKVYYTCRPSNISFVVNCPIDRVWEFYTNIKHLEIITPTEIELKITSATSQKLNQGSEFWFVGKLMISKRKWHSVIKSIGQYQYLDEMLTGPLKSGGTYTNSMLLTSTTIKSKLK